VKASLKDREMRWDLSFLEVGLIGGMMLSQRLFSQAEAHSPWSNALWQLGNIIIIAAFLVYFLRKPVGKYLRRRSQKMREDLAQARSQREEARAKLEEIRGRISKLDEDLSSLKRGLLLEAQRERRRVLSEAKKEAEGLLKATHQKIESEVKLAKRRLQEYTARLSVEEAERVLKGTITDEDQQALIRKYLAEMEELQ